ncbi:MAG TPA: chemotaxis protein CheB [Polyangia bacterium]|nr:chemotaxis protein CheB [Polyangia bacterium]
MKRRGARTPARRPRRSARAGPARPASTVPPAPGPAAPNPDEVIIAGVGASAGGLEAFTQLLRALPGDPGFAIVLVQHLSPKHHSALPQLLSKAGPLPVEQAQDGTLILADHVYVVPPNAELTVEGGRLQIAPRPTDGTQYHPIDVFFRSLAESTQSRAFGVLLSGTSSDGVAGLRDVRAAGGTVLVQDPETTEYDGMPRAAIAAGIADLILPPREIAATLMRLTAHHLRPPRDVATSASGTTFEDHHLRRIFALLRQATGVDFSHYKTPTIRRRLHRRMLLQKAPEVGQYIKLLEADPAELQSLYHDLLIQVTRFFREPDSYAALAAKVFPRLVEQRASDVPIRIWIPGCATGEEAYSVAITLLEFLGDAAEATPIQVFATDVSDRAIERARSGIYPINIDEDVSPQRLRRFFTKIDGSYQIAKGVRDLCVFAHQDLTRDPPFSKLDLIVCRNVLIYLDPLLHKKLMSLFHYALKPQGFLILGRAESVGPYGDLFQVFEKKHRIFMRKPSSLRMDIDFQPPDFGTLRTPAGRKPQPAQRSREATGIQGEATRVLISRFAPPGVIVDSDLRIVETRGQTGAFLELSPGEPTLHLFKMLREGLLFSVRAALGEARKTGQVVRKEGIKLRSNGHIRTVAVEVIPLSASSSSERHYLVLFDHPTPATLEAAGATGPVPPGLSPDRDARPGRRSKKEAKGQRGAAALAPPELAPEPSHLRELQQELAASREYLQSIIQDLEATNEELQSANEEILSSNEELQSTNEELDTAKEELQSTNEEINTVNEELQSRNEELSRANSDLINLLAGVQIAIVFVTNDLRVRRFTPMAEKSLNLIASDVGRPIGNIRPNFDCPDLEALIRDAVDNVVVKEREVQDRDGNWILLRVRPYKSVDNRIDGAVLVLLDIDALRKHEQRSQQAEQMMNAIMDGFASALLVLDEDLRVMAANRAFAQKLGVSAAEARGKLISELGSGHWNADALRARLQETAHDGEKSQPVVLEGRFGGDSQRPLRFTMRRVGGPQAAPVILLTIDEARGE